MNKLYPTIATVFLLFASFTFVSAQDDKDKIVSVPTPQPAYVFDEYNPNDISIEDEKQKLELFVTQFKGMPNAMGYIYIYRGLTDYKFDYQKRVTDIDNYFKPFNTAKKINATNLYSIFVGFRNESSIEMIIQPWRAERRLPSSNVSLLDVMFYDNATLEKGTIQKTGQELLNILIKRVEPLYPTAGRYVRASGEVAVLTKIDEKGNVIETKTVVGHPLLRMTCENAVRHWQFKPQSLNEVPVKVVGITVCDFQLTDDLIIKEIAGKSL